MKAAENADVLGAQGQIWKEYIPNMKQAEYMAFPLPVRSPNSSGSRRIKKAIKSSWSA